MQHSHSPRAHHSSSTLSISLLTALALIALMCPTKSYDYNIPQMPIFEQTRSRQQYKINYLQDLDDNSNTFNLQNTDLKDGIISIPLTNQQGDQEKSVNYFLDAHTKKKINNVYYYRVNQLDSQQKGGSNMGNSLCNVVRSVDQDKQIYKYFFTHELKQTPPTQHQAFLSSTISSFESSYIPATPLQTSAYVYKVQETVRHTIIHSITSELRLHKLKITQRKIEIKKQILKQAGDTSGGNQQIGDMGDQKYQKYQKQEQKIVLQREGDTTCQGKDVVGIQEVQKMLVLVCYKQGNAIISKIKTNDTDSKWQIDTNTTSTILSQSAPLLTKFPQSQSLFLHFPTQIYHLTSSQQSLQLSKLEVTKVYTFTPMMLNLPKPVPYLLLCTENGLQFYNLETKQIQYTQKFDNLISMADVEKITYRNGNDVDVQVQDAVQQNGIIMIVLLAQNRKQFIVEIFYEGSKAQSQRAKHNLHINKIYHSYNANTNQAHKYSTSQQEQSQQQPDNINTILKILHPRPVSSSPEYISNNLGILQSKHKLLFFQYGIPRTLSPYITANSQYITEALYPNIIEVEPVANRRGGSPTSKVFNMEDIQSKVKRISMQGFKLVPRFEKFVRYVITLDNNIYVLQVDPTSLWHYEYVCNLNDMGIINQRHSILNDVEISMQSLCQKNITKNGKSMIKLGYCENTKTVQFFVNYLSLQNQRDQSRHYWFIIIGLFVGACILAFGIAFYGHLKMEVNKLKDVINKMRQKRIPISDNSKIQQFSQIQARDKNRSMMKQQQVTID